MFLLHPDEPVRCPKAFSHSRAASATNTADASNVVVTVLLVVVMVVAVLLVKVALDPATSKLRFVCILDGG